MLVTDTTKLELDGTMKKRQGGKKNADHFTICYLGSSMLLVADRLFVTLVGNRLYTSGSIIFLLVSEDIKPHP